MPGMKRDCGGAAGILGGFAAAVKLVRYALARMFVSKSCFVSSFVECCSMYTAVFCVCVCVKERRKIELTV